MHTLRGANLFLNMEVEFLRELEVLQYIASGLGGMLPPNFFYFKWFNLAHSGVFADIIMT